MLFYLIEILLMPYERILEVKQNHKALLIAHVPYVIFISLALFFISKTWIGLMKLIYLVYFVRLVSFFIMVLLARHIYHVRYSTRYALNLFGFVCSTSIGLCIVGNVMHINPYISFVLFLKHIMP